MSGMRCAQLVETEKPLVVSDQPIPIPPSKGLIVRTAYAGICHSDIHAQDDKIALGGEKVFNFTSLPNFKLPMVLGHEIAGVIHSLGTEPGKGSPQLEVGDRVLVYPWIGCNKEDCGFCEHGAGNLCPGTTNSIGIVAHGGFSTHVSVLDRKYVIKVPDSIPMDVASMLPCSGLTSFSALKAGQPMIEEMTKYKGGVSVLVIGAGGLGMWYLQLARAILPSTTRFIVADVSKEKLETVKANGADRTVLWDNQGEESLIEKTKQEGINNWIDVTVDFVNSSVTGQRANNCLGKGGVMICVGLFGGGLGISLPVLALQQRSIFGCNVGSKTDLQELVNLLADKKIQPPPIETINIDGVNNALDRLRQGKINGRCLIKYN